MTPADSQDVRRTFLVLVVAFAILLVVGGTISCAGAHTRRHHRHHRAHRAVATWTGATYGGRWAGWSKSEVKTGDAQSTTIQGVQATAYTVHPGDVPGKNGERAEIVASVANTGAIQGRASTYGWSTWFPDSFVPVAGSSWNIFTQFHESAADGCHPNIALQVDTQHGDERLRLTVRGGQLDAGTCTPASTRTWDFAQLQRDHWYRFGLSVGWSASATDGYVQLTLDGKTVIPRTSLPTLYSGQSAYLKQGFYRQASPFATTVVHSAVTRGAVVPLASSARRP